MIRVFSPDDKIFTSNGDAVIQPFKAKVHKEDNGDYYLDFEAVLSFHWPGVLGYYLIH